MTDAALAPNLADSPPVDRLDRLARSPMAWAFLAVIAALFALTGYGLPPLDRDESRFAQATLQMLETGDYVRINFQDEPRHKKPVGIHWLQAASVSTLSSAEAREIWAYRIPSTLGAILAVLATFWGGRALIGARAAFIGSALLAGTLLLSTEGHIAKTDAMLAGLTTLAIAALARIRMGQGGRWTALVFWGAIGAGTLIKGPITPMVAGLTMLALWVWDGRRTPWAKPLLSFTGPLLAILIVVPWLWAVQSATDGAFLREAITGDFGPKLTGGHEGHFAWPGYHTLLIPILLFPATIWLIPGLKLAWSAIRHPIQTENANAIRFLVAWAVPTLLVMEATPTKLVHYALPIYPALCLLIGAAVAKSPRVGWGSALLAAIPAILLMMVFFGFRGGGLEVFEGKGLELPLAYGAATIAVVAAAHWWLLNAGAMKGTSERLGRVLLIGFLTVVLVKFSAPQSLFPSVMMARADAAANRPEELLAVGYYEPSLVFATGTKTQMLQGKPAGEQATTGTFALVEGREQAAFEAALAARGLYFRPSDGGLATRAFDYSNGDPVRIVGGLVLPVPENAPAP
jgi:4-amino-4-deoxy-L-arabinose transferase-like glycosyltransferase